MDDCRIDPGSMLLGASLTRIENKLDALNAAGAALNLTLVDLIDLLGADPEAIAAKVAELKAKREALTAALAAQPTQGT